MQWFIYSLIGSVSLICLNTLSKLLSLQTIHFLYLAPLSLFTTTVFWFAWQTGSGFGRIWFIQSAMVSLGFFASNYFIIKESISAINLIGIIAIIIGTLLLRA